MAHDYPQITFSVNNVNMQEILKYPPVDQNYDNVINLLKQTTFWILYVPYELRHEDCFTLYGKEALEVQKIYITDVQENLRKLEIGYYGMPTTDCTCKCLIQADPASINIQQVGTSLSVAMSATGGKSPYTYSLDSGVFPPGVTISSTGVISGTPTASGSYEFSILVSDGINSTIKTYRIKVKSLIAFAPASLPATTQSIAYNQTVTASGGLAPYAYSIISGSLPTGLSLNSATGAITGTPTTPGTYNFTIEATDGNSDVGSKAYAVTINNPVLISTATLPDTTEGEVYSQTVSSTGGTGAVTFSVSSGSLPTGLSLNASTGVISGTVTVAGTYNFTITGTDTVGATGNKAYSVVINPPVAVTPSTLPDTTITIPYSQTVTATGGTGTKTYAVTFGSLPTGLSLNTTTGLVSGTPITAGLYNFAITATDTVGATGNTIYNVNINPAITLAPATLPATTENVAYSQTVTASNGTGAKTYALSSGSLPTGLSLNAATGVISGTPTAAGSYTFDITATDTVGATGTITYTTTINAAMTMAPASLPTTTQGVAYNQTVTASNGTGAKTYTVTSGSLPTGLSLNASSGAITGTTTAAATYNFTITATDTVGATVSQPYTVLVNVPLSISPATLPDTTINVAYSQTITGTGGTAPLAYSVSAGSLPAGLSINATTGAITGTPTATGASSFTITVTDANGATASQAYTVTINAAVTVSPATLPDTTINVAYSQTVSASNGTGAKTFSVTSGSLPTGLSLTGASGVISGTPTATGTSNFTITATDTVGGTGSQAYTVVINPAVSITTATLPDTTINVAYNQTVAATGGTGAKTFSVTSGSLPTGLTLTGASGVISGTPTSAATSNFTITATDTVGGTGSQAYTVVVNPAVSITTATLPDTTINVAYNQTVAATGGTGAKTFSVTSGSLPTGLSLTGASGVISGTPTSAATYNFTITATDTVGGTGSQAYTVVINPAVSITTASLADPVVGTAYNQTVSATGGTGSKTFSVTTGLLPAGLSLTGASGVISGTPTTAGAVSFTITATDTVTATDSKPYTITVQPAATTTTTTTPAPTTTTTTPVPTTTTTTPVPTTTTTTPAPTTTTTTPVPTTTTTTPAPTTTTTTPAPTTTTTTPAPTTTTTTPAPTTTTPAPTTTTPAPTTTTPAPTTTTPAPTTTTPAPTTTTPAPTTTTTTTPAGGGGGALPGNSDACTPTIWPDYGSSNTYTFTASSSSQYWQVDNQSRTIYITDAGSTSLRIIRFTDDDCLTPVNSSYTTWPAGVAVSTGGSGVGTNNTIFGIRVTAGGSVTYTIYIA